MSESLREICNQFRIFCIIIYFPKVRIHFRVQEEQFLEQIFLLWRAGREPRYYLFLIYRVLWTLYLNNVEYRELIS
jgi:hypothetical protein